MTQHQLLRRYIEGLTKGLSTSLLVIGNAGIGKTEMTINTLQELGLEEGKHYRYFSNYVSPLELFTALKGINDLQPPKIAVCDDFEDTLRQERAVGVLKGALWSLPNGQRRVMWNSGTYKVKEKQFNFTGKLIFLLNHFNNKNSIHNALRDRSLCFQMDLNQEEVKRLIFERAKIPYQNTSYEQRLKVAKFLGEQNNSNMSLRIYPHALNMLILSPHHWQELTFGLLNGKRSVNN